LTNTSNVRARLATSTSTSPPQRGHRPELMFRNNHVSWILASATTEKVASHGAGSYNVCGCAQIVRPDRLVWRQEEQSSCRRCCCYPLTSLAWGDNFSGVERVRARHDLRRLLLVSRRVKVDRAVTSNFRTNNCAAGEYKRFRLRNNSSSNQNRTSCAGGRHNMPRTLQVDL